jgi:uncharacterized protein (TIGR03492 family)
MGFNRIAQDMKLLCLSNGHGEDAIALRILQHLQQHPNQPKLMALPLVGEGRAFTDSGIAIAGPVKRMPSGGFIYMDSRQLARDLRGGLLQLTWEQLQVVKTWTQEGGAILAVGDIVPLLFAWWSGAPYAFVGTAKSDYYQRDEIGLLPRKSWFDDRLERWWGSVYHPWERWLMSRDRCKAVFPRDTLTTSRLKKWAIPAVDLGNPMMDGLEPTGQHFIAEKKALGSAQSLTVVLLPGSRPPEAYENWQVIMAAAAGLISSFRQRSLLFLAAIAPTLDLDPLYQTLQVQGWQPAEHLAKVEVRRQEADARRQGSNTQASTSSLTFTQRNATLILTQTGFSDCLHQADFAIAMAGTATEQFVGLGKPAIILPGSGPQFTHAFAEAQTRLLGPSAILVKQPAKAADAIYALLQDPDRLQLIADNGYRRLGQPGAAQRIAYHLMDVMDVR